MAKAKGPRNPGRCTVKGCGRRLYSHEMCRTHQRQFAEIGKTGPIRPYRQRTPGTVKFAGISLSADCVSALKRYARQDKLSTSAAIANVLEAWSRSRNRKPR